MAAQPEIWERVSQIVGVLGGVSGLVVLGEHFLNRRRFKVEREDKALEREDKTKKEDRAVALAADEQLLKRDNELWARMQGELKRVTDRADRNEKKIEAQGVKIESLEGRVEELETALETARTALAESERKLKVAETEVKRLTILTAEQASEIQKLHLDVQNKKAEVLRLEKLLRPNPDRTGDALQSGDAVVIVKDADIPDPPL